MRLNQIKKQDKKKKSISKEVYIPKTRVRPDVDDIQNNNWYPYDDEDNDNNN